MATRKTEDQKELTRLKQALSAQSLGSLYVFHGEEAYLRDYYLEEMKQQLVGGWEAFCYHRFPGKGLSLQALSDTIDTLPVGAMRTMIVVYDYDLYQTAGRDELMSILSDLPEYCCLVFVYDILPYKADARTKMHALLKEKGSIVSFAQQAQSDLVRWIGRRFSATGHAISAADAEYLIFLCGGLMTGLISEIGKISAYAAAPQITRADIDAVAEPTLDAVVFQMTDAVLRGESERALRVLSDLLRMQQPPIMILSVLGKQMRQLHAAKLALDAGKPAAYLTALWGMRSSYPAQNLLRSAKRRDLAWCQTAVKRCAETDFAIKQTGVKPEEQLTLLLLWLVRRPEAGGNLP